MKPFLVADFNNLHEYVQSISAWNKSRAGSQTRALPFITISRQTGAGGHSLAEALLDRMRESHSSLFEGWQILDQKLCEKVLDDPQMKVSLESLLTEKFVKDMEDYLSQIFAGRSPQIAVFHKIAGIVRTFASIGKVIIVGRAGSLLTRDLPLGVHARIVASKESRVATMMRQFHLSKAEAEAQVREQDRSRANLVKTYFNGKDIDDPLLYDMVWNGDSVPIPAIASFLLQLVEQKANASKSARPAELEKAEAELSQAEKK